MSKKIISKLASLTALAIVPMPLVSIVSCDKGELKISFPDKNLSGDSKSFTFNGLTDNRARKGLKVEILGEDSYLQYLSLAKEVVSITSGSIDVEINVSEAFNVKYTFGFSLRFTDVETNRQFTVNGFHIIFKNQPAKEDIVRIDHRSLEKTYEYHFTYKFYFSAKPLNEGIVKISLIDPSSQLIECQNEGEVVREKEFYVLYVNINVDLELAESLIAEFSIRLEFQNSFNIKQTETFDDCALRFYADKNHEIIPTDYYEIENGVIKGISHKVTQETIQRFNTIRIPNGVTSIDKSVFDGSDTTYNFDNITTLILPRTVQTLPVNCFKALHSLYYIDLTDYAEWPTWFKTKSSSQSVFSTKPTEDFKYNGGIVWVRQSNNKLDIRSTYVNPTFGYTKTPYYWDVCEKEAIMPDSYYITETNNETGDVTLKGLDKKYKDTFRQYQILKIPSDVTIVAEGAFNLLDRITYETEGKNYNRRLIPNKNLKKIESWAFAGASIGGCALFDCPYLEEIAEFGFDEIMYTDVRNQVSYNSVTSMSGIYWKDCKSLNKIGGRCFPVRKDGHPGCQLQPYFTIPESVTEIGEYLFVDEMGIPDDDYYVDTNTASKIVFENCKDLKFGARAFGHIGSIQEIDFSAVSYENFMTWTVGLDAFKHAGQKYIVEEEYKIVPVVYLNKDLTENQFNEIKSILEAAGLIDEYTGKDWEYERK